MRADGVRGQALRARLGPDLLAEDTDVASLPVRAREILPADAPLTDALLDQRVAAGIGNEYKSELLFLAGLSPHRTLGSVDDETLVFLFALARDLLLRNLGLRAPHHALCR
jgi:endonuclease VIII